MELLHVFVNNVQVNILIKSLTYWHNGEKVRKTMNEMMTINTTTLANKDLKKHLNEIKKAVETIGANRWKVADALRKIAENDEYKDDFKTDAALAEALGMKRQNFQKLVKASKYHAECKTTDENGNNVLLLDGFSVSAVFEIIVIPIEEVETYFYTMSGTEYEVTKESTCKAVRESVQTYKAWTDDSAETDIESVESDTELAESSESDTATAEKRGDEELINAITSITDFLNHASREEVLEVKEYIEGHYNND